MMVFWSSSSSMVVFMACKTTTFPMDLSQKALVPSILFLVVRPGAPSSFLFRLIRPGAPSSFLLLIIMPGAPSSFLFLVVRSRSVKESSASQSLFTFVRFLWEFFSSAS